MMIKTTDSPMTVAVKVPLSVLFDEATCNFTVDITHENARRLTELAFQTVELAGGPHENETVEDYTRRFEEQKRGILDEVKSLSNEATAHEYAVGLLVLNGNRIRKKHEKQAAGFLSAFPDATECNSYFLDVLYDAGGLEAVFSLGVHMGRGECDKLGRTAGL